MYIPLYVDAASKLPPNETKFRHFAPVCLRSCVVISSCLKNRCANTCR